MNSAPSLETWIKPVILMLGFLLLVACSDSNDSDNPTVPPEPEDPNIVRIDAGPDFEMDLKTALIEAQPGTMILLPEGEFDMTGGLILDVSNVIVRGEGEAAIILNYAQSTGGDSFLVTSNNNALENFAPEGNIVATVPQGTGMLIEDNQSEAIVVVNYAISGLANDDPLYDPDPRRINIHDNQYGNNGYDPKDLAADIAGLFDGVGGLPQIVYDGIAEQAGAFEDEDRICVREAPEVSRGRVFTSKGGASLDQEFFNCAHASLPAVELDSPGDIEDGETPPTDEEIAARCTPEAGSTEPNFAALEVNCPTLDGYNLFADTTEPREKANDGIHYDLITPLFTDYASKYRFIFVPAGQQGGYSSTEVMDFPVGTIIAKTFTMRNDFLNSGAGEVMIETRLLLHRADGWAALPYLLLRRSGPSGTDRYTTGAVFPSGDLHLACVCPAD